MNKITRFKLNASSRKNANLATIHCKVSTSERIEVCLPSKVADNRPLLYPLQRKRSRTSMFTIFVNDAGDNVRGRGSLTEVMTVTDF